MSVEHFLAKSQATGGPTRNEVSGVMSTWQCASRMEPSVVEHRLCLLLVSAGTVQGPRHNQPAPPMTSHRFGAARHSAHCRASVRTRSPVSNGHVYVYTYEIRLLHGVSAVYMLKTADPMSECSLPPTTRRVRDRISRQTSEGHASNQFARERSGQPDHPPRSSRS